MGSFGSLYAISVLNNATAISREVKINLQTPMHYGPVFMDQKNWGLNMYTVASAFLETK